MFMQIDPSRKYWLVRTYGGRYYEEFIKKQIIALGWDEIDNISLIKGSAANEATSKELKLKVEQEYFKNSANKQNRSTYISEQIRTFVNEIKTSDIVVIPSANSSLVTFGQVESDVFLQEDFEKDEKCHWRKRKKTRWLKTIKRDDLDPHLYKLFYSHHAVSNAIDYSDYIDRTLYSFFVKGDTAHLVLDVQKKDTVYASDFISLLTTIFNLTDKFNEEMNEHLDKNAIGIKTSVNSPGPIQIFGSIDTILAVALFFGVMLGGNIFGMKFNEGILDKILKFINESHSYKIEKEKLDIARKKLEIEIPETTTGNLDDKRNESQVQELELSLKEAAPAKED